MADMVETGNQETIIVDYQNDCTHLRSSHAQPLGSVTLLFFLSQAFKLQFDHVKSIEFTLKGLKFTERSFR